jgi:hypothetical protein
MVWYRKKIGKIIKIMIEQKPNVIDESGVSFDSTIPGARHVWGCNEEVFLKRLAMAHGEIWRARFKRLPWVDHPLAFKSVMIAGLSGYPNTQRGEYMRRLSGITLTKEMCYRARNLPPTV